MSEPITTKYCIRCGVVKPIDQFNRCEQLRKCYRTKCAKCTKEVGLINYRLQKDKRNPPKPFAGEIEIVDGQIILSFT